jgi:RNA polymerase sigma factor (sigma-70 family)
MSATPVSLLERLRLRQDDHAWSELVALYDPLLRGWLRRQSLQSADVDDLVQEVFGILLSKLPEFRHNRQQGAFRNYLRRILGNCLLNRWRARRTRRGENGDVRAWQALQYLQDPDSELSRLWELEHNRYVANRFMQQAQEHFEPATCQAFRGVVVDGKSPTVVAAELGLTANAVRLAKFRVLRWLREASEGLLD